MEAQAEYETIASCYDTPHGWKYYQYDIEKAKIFWSCKDEKEYGRRLTQLKDELGL